MYNSADARKVKKQMQNTKSTEKYQTEKFF